MYKADVEKQKEYGRIIREFNHMPLKDKVDFLVHEYAHRKVYGTTVKVRRRQPQ